jgi:hypothetical protein
MKLPEIHRTARYKSLPKGLKAKADAIIKKKFGIKDVKKVPKKDHLLDHINKDMMNGMWEVPTPRYAEGVIRRIHHRADRLDAVAEVQCMGCGRIEIRTIDERQLGHGYRRVDICNCGCHVETRITREDLQRSRVAMYPQEYHLF